MFMLQFFNYLDRVNVSFAALLMNHDLRFSGSIYGFGASVFFLGYMVLQVPSNLILHRLGARVWICAILVSWGLVAASMAFVYNAGSFYSLRFMLGLAEGGLLPGIVFYLTYWFPSHHRARANNGWVIASLIAPIVGGPISTMVMTYCDGFLGLRGWKWMFIVEGLPTVLLGIIVLYWLTNKPSEADWLDSKSREWLESTIKKENVEFERRQQYTLGRVVREPRVWSLGFLFACVLVALYGLILWLPQIIKSLGKLSVIQVGFLTAVPFMCGATNSILMSRHSDRVGERKLHLAANYALGGLALLAAAFASNPILAYILLCVASVGIFAVTPIFWTIVGTFMTGAAAAAGIAFINTIAQLGGLAGPWVIGIVQDATHSYKLALVTLAFFQLTAAGIALMLKDTESVIRAETVSADGVIKR
jgi:ACS family tartrate transporter-like MFS transporter